MEISIRIGCAVGGNKKIRIVKIRRVYGNKLYLNGPLGKLTCYGRGFTSAGRIGFPINSPGVCSRTAAGKRFSGFFLFRFQNRRFVISRSFTFFKGYRACWTSRKTISQTVAVVLPHKLRFSVHNVDSALVTGFGAYSAAGAFFLVNFYNFSYHVRSTPCFFILLYNNKIKMTRDVLWKNELIGGRFSLPAYVKPLAVAAYFGKLSL